MSVAALPHAPHDAHPAAPARALRAPALLTSVLAALTVLVTLMVAPGAASAGYTPPTVPTRTAAESAMIKAVLTELNNERKANGRAALTLNSNLMLSARRHDVTMRTANTLSHQLPGEPVFTSRITSAGYKWRYAGENIAWTSTLTTAAVIALQKMMYNEKAPNNGHRINILNSNYKDVGIDILGDSTHHKIWFTTDFGQR